MSLWLLLVLMSLATYRATRFLVEDTFPPVLWLRDRLAGGWRPITEKEWAQLRTAGSAHMPWEIREVEGVENRWVERWKRSPHWLTEMLSCPWCASGWVSAGVTAGVWATVGMPLPFLVWGAVWAAGALIAAQEWA